MAKTIGRINFLVTYGCNLKCKYCYLGDKREPVAGQDFSTVVPSAEEVARIYTESNVKVERIRIYGAEPTIVPADILGQAVKKLRSIVTENGRILFATNGTLLTEEYINTLKSYEPDILRWTVSIDGPEEITDKYRGKGTFRKAMRGAELLQKAGYLVQIQGVYSNEILKNPDIREKFEIDMRNKGFLIRFIFPHHNNPIDDDIQKSYAEHCVANRLSNRDIVPRKEPIDCFRHLEEDARYDAKGRLVRCHLYDNDFIDVAYQGKTYEQLYKTIPLKEITSNVDSCTGCEIQKYCINFCPLDTPKVDIPCTFRKRVFELEAEYHKLSIEKMIEIQSEYGFQK